MAIKLVKNTFLDDAKTRRELSDFVRVSKHLSMGEVCLKFESEFSSFHGMSECILFNSGASANLALLQALKNLGRIKAGDKIAFSAVTWATNVMPIIQLGFVPVPIDVSIYTLNSSSVNLVNAIRRNDIKVFFITNALGFTGDLDNIRRLCEKNGIILLEDNCESLGTRLPAGMAGTFGLASTFSFYVSHHLSTIEGGAVLTNDSDLHDMLRMVRSNGWDRNLHPNKQKKLRKRHNVKDFNIPYTFYDLGYNLRPTEITGFLGLNQLKLLYNSLQKRQENYFYLSRRAEENPHLVHPFRLHIDFLSSFAFPVICRDSVIRKEYIERFRKAGIETRPIISGSITRQPFWAKYVKTAYELPGADIIHDFGFYCANNPDLTRNELMQIAKCLEP